jgi:hypothetical protein
LGAETIIQFALLNIGDSDNLIVLIGRTLHVLSGRTFHVLDRRTLHIGSHPICGDVGLGEMSVVDLGASVATSVTKAIEPEFVGYTHGTHEDSHFVVVVAGTGSALASYKFPAAGAARSIQDRVACREDLVREHASATSQALNIL